MHDPFKITSDAQDYFSVIFSDLSHFLRHCLLSNPSIFSPSAYIFIFIHLPSQLQPFSVPLVSVAI